MSADSYIKFVQENLTRLTEEERQLVLESLTGLSHEVGQLVVAYGQQINKTSTINGMWYWRTLPVIQKALTSKQLYLWLEDTLKICKADWENGLAFFKVSPSMMQLLNSENLILWTNLGRELCKFNNSAALNYFKQSQWWFEQINNKIIGSLLINLLSMVKNAWAGINPCLYCFTKLKVTDAKKDMILRLGSEVCLQIPDAAAEFFEAVPRVLDWEEIKNLTVMASLAKELKTAGSLTVVAYFQALPQVVKYLAKENNHPYHTWVQWGQSLHQVGSSIGSTFFLTTPSVLRSIQWHEMVNWVMLIEKIKDTSPIEIAEAFIRITPELLQQLDLQEMEQWVNHGLQWQNEKRFVYFSLRSQESREAMVRLRCGTHLESVKRMLALYAEALTGTSVLIRKVTDLPRIIHEDNKLFSTLDFRRIYLPELIKIEDYPEVNIKLYRAQLMHQIAHQEFGTLSLPVKVIDELVKDPELSLIFELLEDNRVDFMAIKKYPGLAEDFEFFERKTKPSEKLSLVDYLMHFLWFKQEQRPLGLQPEIFLVAENFWHKVTANQAKVQDSITTAKSIVDILRLDGSKVRAESLTTLLYRGRLNFQLLYIAKCVETEVGEENSLEHLKAPVALTKQNGFDSYQIELKKLLEKFRAEEDNPYRLIAYYDEWDRVLNDYKKDWCKVREIVLKPSTGRIVTKTLADHYGMINTLKRYFGMLRPDRFQRYRRQEEGEQLDIDAIIEAMVEKHTGCSLPKGFYVRRDKRERNVAVAFLLDLSYSTEEMISSSAKSLLEVEEEAVIVMAEALEVLGDKYAIYGFNSDGRENVNFYVVKDFEEGYTTEVKLRFGGLQSYGMTRLASAIRHAAEKLTNVQAATKLLIILTDGRPFDFDYNSGVSKDYEKNYPESDTRMALREAKMRGIHPFCITVDNKGQDYLDYIFGNVSYIIIDNVQMLPNKLWELYKQLTT